MRRALRALASLVGLAAAVGGVPAVLVATVGWPLPSRPPAVEEVRRALGDGWRPDEAFVLGALALVAWVLWSRAVLHIVAQMRAQARSRARGAHAGLAPALASAPGPPAGRGLSRRLAAWLVSGLILSGPVLPSVAMAHPQPIEVVLGATDALAAPLTPTGTAPGPAPPTADAEQLPAYVVRTWAENRDCLWNIAERYLGDPFRWTEIRDLNADRLQADGRRLGAEPRSWVYPGWELWLPVDASGAEVVDPAEPPTTPPTAAPSAQAPSIPPAEATPPTPPSVVVTAPPAPRSAVPPPAVPPATQPAPTSGGGRNAVSGSVPWTQRAALAGALGLPIFAIGGWVTRLRRGRIAQASHARPGRDVVRAEAPPELERRAVAIAADGAEEWVDAALRALTAALGEWAGPIPKLHCVRAGDLGIEILWAEATPAAPEGWASADDGHVWRVAPGVSLAELQRRGADRAVAAPGLVSLGATPEGPILADLEGFGVLSVDGDAGRVRTFLAGVALEVASASWAAGVELRVHGLPGSGDNAEADALEAEARSWARLADGRPQPVTDLLAVRAADPYGAEPWYPMVIVVGPQAAPGVAERLGAIATSGRGVVVVGAGPIGVASWQLAVAESGAAVLKPLGLRVRVGGVADDDEAAPVAAFEVLAVGEAEGAQPTPAEVSVTTGTADAWDSDQLSAEGSQGVLSLDHTGLDEAAILAAAGALAATSETDDIAAPIPISSSSSSTGVRRQLLRRDDAEVWVSVLRRSPEITGWAIEPRGRRKLAEVLVYLAVFGAERAVPTTELRTQCWPPRFSPAGPGERGRFCEVSNDTFHQAMSRLRRQLGEGSTGWHLPSALDGAYLLGELVGCDWVLFQALSALASEAAGRHQHSRAIGHLREALELVQGEPFADVAPGTHGWAESEHLVTDIRLGVTRAADQLAQLAMVSDPQMARWAAQQGLRLLPTQLELFDTWMTAAAAAGDASGIAEALAAKQWAYAQLDPEAGVPAETMELYRHLMAKVKRSSTPVAAG